MDRYSTIHVATAALILIAAITMWFVLPTRKQWWFLAFILVAAFFATRLFTTR